MYNLINKVVDFIESIPSIVKLIGVATIVIFLFIWAAAGFITNVSVALEQIDSEYKQRQEAYEQRIEEVKRDCDLRQQVISPTSTTYRYRCAGGVDFEFEEAL